MSVKTGIEWTDATWNPIRGCSPVSPGCKNCYASKVAKRFSGPGQPYEGLVRINAAGERTDEWNGVVRPVEKHLLDPLKWKEPRRIFVNSMSDLFHENLSDEEIDKVFAVMFAAPQHDFQVLTKRPDRMMRYLSQNNKRYTARRIVDSASALGVFGHVFDCDLYFPLPNVRLGVSVENQKAADERLGTLAMLGGMGWSTMVSFEPLLGPVMPLPVWLSLGPETWAIVGGESGPGARPMHPDWARDLRDLCQAAGVPFFFKQWGDWAPGENVDRLAGVVETATWFNGGWLFDRENLAGDEGHRDDEPDLYRVGKKKAGRWLDGVEWNQFPEECATSRKA